MTLAVMFIAGFLLGSLRFVQRSLESLRWIAIRSWARRQGIEIEELEGLKALRLVDYSPKPEQEPSRLRRAK